MPIRALTPFEITVADAVVELGNLKGWEFAAFLEAPSGPLLEFITRMLPGGADPSNDILSRTAPENRVVIHHNHLSQESLSFPDWTGLTVFAEQTFAHCADDTCYWGKVINETEVNNVLSKAQTVEISAETFLFDILNNIDFSPLSAELAGFFRKEVVNRAMKLRGYVEYEFFWGSRAVNPPPSSGRPAQTWSAGTSGSCICTRIDEAATQLASIL
ncbi:hypothetical protein [Asaia spathodeae]|uniref:Uncharacterized protein n=1 Tax=Asaia spathodeae TaxID=657016 RepID=A0ABX2P6Q0_9PROT|nr:hypothetical protein [Asaia spathodeae]GBR19619.1 hypothetical protein AA105894_2356 [Asaia spathodeae NBRC 105894]